MDSNDVVAVLDLKVLAYGFPRLMKSDILVSMISEIRNADSYDFKSLIRESQ